MSNVEDEPDRPWYQAVEIVSWGGHGYVIKSGDVLYPTSEYQIETYTFRDPELAAEMAGAIFKIRPYGSTRVVRVTDPETKVTDVPIRGSGWFLRLTAGGEVEYEEIDAEDGQASFIYGFGDVIVWIAGKQGLDVLNIMKPPFHAEAKDGEAVLQPASEAVINIDSEEMPGEFWEEYHALKNKGMEI